MKAAQSLISKLILRKRDLRGCVKGNNERNRAKEKNWQDQKYTQTHGKPNMTIVWDLYVIFSTPYGNTGNCSAYIHCSFQKCKGTLNLLFAFHKAQRMFQA